MKLAIGVPLATEWVSSQFWYSYENLVKPKDHILITLAGALTPFAREKIVLKALKENCTHLLFIDSDMTFGPDALEKLDGKKDIMAGLFFKRYSPYDPAFTVNDKVVIPDKLIEVDWVGLAFTLIDMKIFKTMPRPWFELDFNPEHIVGEDVLFCVKAKKLGFKVWVDPKVEIGHQLTVSVRKNKDGMLKIRR